MSTVTGEPAGICVKQRRVLEDVGEYDGFIIYGRTEEDDPRAGTEYMMTEADYKDLGSPKEITVTIEAGNILQEDREQLELSDLNEDKVGAFSAGAQSTSREAALSVYKSQKADANLIIGLFMEGNHTDDEIEVSMGISHQTASARRRGLVLGNWVEDSGEKRLTRRGRKAIVWQLTSLACRELFG